MKTAKETYAALGIETDYQVRDIPSYARSMSERDESSLTLLQERQKVARKIHEMRLWVDQTYLRSKKINGTIAESGVNFARYLAALPWLAEQMLECVDDVHKARQRAMLIEQHAVETKKVRAEVIDSGIVEGTALRKVKRYAKAFLAEVEENLDGEKDPEKLRNWIEVLLGRTEAPKDVYRKQRSKKKEAKNNDGHRSLDSKSP